jgi:hypothetical protein
VPSHGVPPTTRSPEKPDDATGMGERVGLGVGDDVRHPDRTPGDVQHLDRNRIEQSGKPRQRVTGVSSHVVGGDRHRIPSHTVGIDNILSTTRFDQHP